MKGGEGAEKIVKEGENEEMKKYDEQDPEGQERRHLLSDQRTSRAEAEMVREVRVAGLVPKMHGGSQLRRDAKTADARTGS